MKTIISLKTPTYVALTKHTWITESVDNDKTKVGKYRSDEMKVEYSDKNTVKTMTKTESMNRIKQLDKQILC